MPASEHHSNASHRAPPPPNDGAGGIEGDIEIGAVANIGAPEQVGLLTARFVRYPGCQQLTLWLPQSGYHGYGALRVLMSNSKVIEQTTVAERLNGSVQILWDTLEWEAGAYRIEIDHDDGWRHVLALRKFEPIAESEEPAPVPRVMAPRAPSPEAASRASAPIVYRDGFGRVLPDQDMVLRKQALEDLKNRFSRRLRYDGNFRAGTITYVEGDLQIAFSHEMGGGGCKFYIDVPSAAQWEAHTGTPLARRGEILLFVAQTVQREQASSWRYKIEADTITYW